MLYVHEMGFATSKESKMIEDATLSTFLWLSICNNTNYAAKRCLIIRVVTCERLLETKMQKFQRTLLTIALSTDSSHTMVWSRLDQDEKASVTAMSLFNNKIIQYDNTKSKTPFPYTSLSCRCRHKSPILKNRVTRLTRIFEFGENEKVRIKRHRCELSPHQHSRPVSLRAVPQTDTFGKA